MFQRKVRHSDFERALNEEEARHFLSCPNADFLSRAAALTLDWMFLYLIQLMLMSGAKIWDSPNPRHKLLLNFLIHSFVALLSFFWHVWATSRWGGSPGKLLLGLRVLDEKTGANLTVLRALAREFLGKSILGTLTLGIDYLSPLFRSDRTAWHDRLTGTSVKRVRGK